MTSVKLEDPPCYKTFYPLFEGCKERTSLLWRNNVYFTVGYAFTKLVKLVFFYSEVGCL